MLFAVLKKSVSIIIVFCSAVSLQAQLVFHDAALFPLLGRATEATEARYVRLPDSLKGISRSPVWELSRNSSGMAIRFRTNSTQIAVKWESLINFHMDHMTDVGVKGLDLYCWEENKNWRFINSARPTGKSSQVILIANMQPEEREFMLYLPLYDGIASLSMGVDSSSEITQPLVDYPIREKPVVLYGTSILQGGCASRPGMAHTNIISRRLNRECINLGFSGNAFLDFEIAEVMAKVDASVFVLDFVPNTSIDQMEERMEKFYRIIRNKHPNTPIVFIEAPIFADTYYNKESAKNLNNKNQTLRKIFNKLKAEKEKNIALISSKNMLGNDREATVDGIHFTDLGMMRYADLVCPILKKLIK